MSETKKPSKRSRKPRPIKVADEDSVAPVVLGPMMTKCLHQVAKELRATPEDVLRAGWVLALVNEKGSSARDAFKSLLWDLRGRTMFPAKHICEKVGGDWSWMEHGAVLKESKSDDTDDDLPGDEWKKA
jgi:hypothetical protein